MRFTVPQETLRDRRRRAPAAAPSGPLTGPLSAVLVAGERTGQAQPPTRLDGDRERAAARPRRAAGHLRQRLRLPRARRGLRRASRSCASGTRSSTASRRRTSACRASAWSCRSTSRIRRSYRFGVVGAKPRHRQPARRRPARSSRPTTRPIRSTARRAPGISTAGSSCDGPRGVGRPGVALVLAGVPAEHHRARRSADLQPVGARGATRQGRRRASPRRTSSSSGSRRRRRCRRASAPRWRAPLLGVRRSARTRAQRRAAAGAVAARRRATRFVAQGARRRAALRRAQRRRGLERLRRRALRQAGLERPRTGAYGMWNWGDWNFRGYQRHHQGLRQLGQPRVRHRAGAGADLRRERRRRTYTIRWSPRRGTSSTSTRSTPARTRPEWVGMNHPKNPLHFSFELGGPDLGHTWTQGSLAYYYLTGDERGLDAARGIADYLVERVQRRRARQPAPVGLAADRAAGGLRRDRRSPLPRRGACLCARAACARIRRPASTQWKLGILADALAYTHAATGDATIKAWLEQYAAAVMKRQAREDVRAFPAVAYVAALTGDAAMRAGGARTRRPPRPRQLGQAVQHQRADRVPDRVAAGGRDAVGPVPPVARGLAGCRRYVLASSPVAPRRAPRRCAS